MRKNSKTPNNEHYSLPINNQPFFQKSEDGEQAFFLSLENGNQSIQNKDGTTVVQKAPLDKVVQDEKESQNQQFKIGEVREAINSTLKVLRREDKFSVKFIQKSILLEGPAKYNYYRMEGLNYLEELDAPTAEVETANSNSTQFKISVGKKFMLATGDNRKEMLRPVLKNAIVNYNKGIEIEHLSGKSKSLAGAKKERIVNHLIDLFLPQYADISKQMVFIPESSGIKVNGTKFKITISVGEKFLNGIRKDNINKKGKELQAAIHVFEKHIGTEEDKIIRSADKALTDKQSSFKYAEAIHRLVNLYLPAYSSLLRVEYLPQLKGIKVAARKGALIMNIGHEYLQNLNKKNLEYKAQQLRNKLEDNAQIKHLLIQERGPDKLRQLIQKYIDTNAREDPAAIFVKYNELVDKIKFDPSLRGAKEVKITEKNEKLDVSFGVGFGEKLLVDSKQAEKQSPSLVDKLYLALSKAAKPLLINFLASSAFRKDIKELFKKWAGWDGKNYKGVYESRDQFKKFMKPGTIRGKRHQAAREVAQKRLKNPNAQIADKAWTSCIRFQIFLIQQLEREYNWKKLGKSGGYHMVDRAPEGSTFKAFENMPRTMRPRSGDILHFKSPDRTQDLHVSFLDTIEVNEDGTETWKTIDGGQGTSGKYKYNASEEEKTNKKITGKGGSYELLQKGNEKIDENERTYDPKTNLIIGEGQSHDSKKMWVYGWINSDKYFEKKK